MYLVEGLEGGRFAIISKTHHAMVDGISAVDIGQVILDVTPTPGTRPRTPGCPRRSRATIEPRGRGGRGTGPAPDRRWPTRSALGVVDLRAHVGWVIGARRRSRGGGPVAARPAPSSRCNVAIGEQRRFGVGRTDLDDYKRVRKAHGGTVNDVVLAVGGRRVAGWLLSRGEAVTASTTIRAMVPVSVRTDEQRAAGGNRVSSYLVDLPVGEPDPVVRLSPGQLRDEGAQGAGSVGRRGCAGRARRLRPADPALARRPGGQRLTRRLFNLVVSNVPGPQFPLYAGGAQLLELLTRWCRSLAGRGSASGSPPTTAGSTTGSTPTAMRCPTWT